MPLFLRFPLLKVSFSLGFFVRSLMIAALLPTFYKHMAKRSGNNNTGLTSAKNAKNDEFYTQLPDIEKELIHYKSQLKCKAVFCNCDDPAESNFFFYFVLKFKELKLKKIITTHYVPEGSSYKIEVSDANTAKKIATSIKQGYDFNSESNLSVLRALGIVTPLLENGDFRSPECIELLRQADVVITNPPFSMFREYVAQLVEYEKKFIIIGNTNSLTYKEIFKLIKENKLRTGYTNFNVGMYFVVPDHWEDYHRIENGRKLVRVSTSCWFTNLEVQKHKEFIKLYKRYTPMEYPKYDNYDAIEVSRVAEIPMDYDGAMGVPITFLDKYNPEQFEILSSNDFRVNQDIPFKEHGLIKDKDSAINGKPTYVRIVIKRKKNES